MATTIKADSQSRKAILFRTGGLGDFVLTVPLLREIGRHFDEVLLITRPRYFSFADSLGFSLKLGDADIFDAKRVDFVQGATVFTFWSDDDWVDDDWGDDEDEEEEEEPAPEPEEDDEGWGAHTWEDENLEEELNEHKIYQRWKLLSGIK